MHLVEFLLSLIAPHICLTCHSLGSVLCSVCIQTIKPAPYTCYRCGVQLDFGHICAGCSNITGISQVNVFALYENVAQALVRTLKYGRTKDAARTIATCLASKGVVADFAVAPIPTAPSRVRQRGYDQAVVISKEFARLTGVQYAQVLRRQTSSRQVGATRQERLANMHASFVPQSLTNIHSKKLMLIDDVLTTGATIESATQSLLKAGAQEVRIMTFAYKALR
jgi:ComF family protein